MLSRIRRAAEEKDEGFTLIELLVVIIIIGILAAIAIPVFLNQRKKAQEASVKSDLRTVANAMETYYVDAKVYPSFSTATATVTIGAGAQAETVTLSKGNVMMGSGTVATGIKAGTFCLMAANTTDGTLSGVSPADITYYDSDMGGIQPKGTGCGDPSTPTPVGTN